MIKKIYNKFKTVINYILSSGSSFIIDIILFTIFLKIFNNILIAGYLARAISSICNYLINKYLVFNYKNKNNKTNTLFSYFSLVIINITISNILVSLLNTKTGINASIIKIVIDCLIFISNYYIQKYIIFKDNKDSKYYKYIMPVISFIALYIHTNKNGIIWDYNIYDYFIMIFSIVIIYYMYLKLFKDNNNKGINILSLIFSIFMVIGYSYNKTHSAVLLYNHEIHILITLIKLIGFYHLFKNLLSYLYEFLANNEFKDKPGVLKDAFRKHPFIYSFIILFLIYGFYLLAYYPGIINYDNANQIKEVMGIHNRYLDSVVVINKNITLTNFNPIIHTLLLGNLFKFGSSIGNVNLGLFIYTFIQMIVIISISAYSIKFLNDECIKTRYIIIVLLLYILLPFFPYYSITCVKDSYWTSFFMLYLIKIYQLIKYKYKIKDYLVLLGIIFLLILFRNNGFVPILCSLPFIIVFKPNIRKQILLITIITFAFTLGYTRVIKLFDIPNTSPREALSVPFQQTARYIKDYPDDIKDNERLIIDKILDINTIAERYEYELSDKVKNKFNIYTTKGDLKVYFKAWASMFYRHPDSYINAFISNNYAYIYPDTYDWYIYSKLNPKLPEAGFNYHFNGRIVERMALKVESLAFYRIPIVCLLISCGFYTWLYLFLYIIIKLKKKMELIILLLPAYSLIFMCLIGPANTYFRYVYPYAATAPIIILLIIKNINKSILIKK